MSKDMLDGLEEFMKDFSENVRVAGDIQFPVEISGVETKNGVNHRSEKVGSWVSIRPCDSDKTYLGVYLGDLNLAPQHHYHLQTKVLSIHPHTNPAIYVPDLKRVIWGCESWWGIIRKPEELQIISDADIQNIWYVKALIELSEQQPKPASDED